MSRLPKLAPFAVSAVGRTGRGEANHVPLSLGSPFPLPLLITNHQSPITFPICLSPPSSPPHDSTTRACGDAAGWTAPARESFRSWSHGEATERSGDRESIQRITLAFHRPPSLAVLSRRSFSEGGSLGEGG